MKILLSGASGLIGSALVSALKAEGHVLAFLVRRKADPNRNEIYFEPERGSVDKSALEAFGPEAVIHLAGDPIAKGRWTAKKKAAIRNSRINGTAALTNALIHLEKFPAVFISASAIGYYGTRWDEILTEESPPGDNFLAQVCRDWEAATQAAVEKGIRVVNLRFGMILSKKGGALKKLLLPFKLGLGGIIGNGQQYMSWITDEDVVNLISFALKHPSLQGPVNAVTPHPVTNREFTRTLGRVLWRPTCLPLPASTARMLLGEMADDLLLASARVKPAKLEAEGFKFRYPELRGALEYLLK